MVPQVFLTFRFIPLFSFYPNPHTILKSSDSQVILRLTGPDSLPEGICFGKRRLGGTPLRKRSQSSKRKVTWRPRDQPITLWSISTCCPKQHQPPPPYFQDHLSLHSTVPALLLLLLPKDNGHLIRKYLSFLLSDPAISSSLSLINRMLLLVFIFLR